MTCNVLSGTLSLYTTTATATTTTITTTAVFTSVSSVGYAIVLSLHFVDFVKFLLWVVCVDCIGVGVIIATTLW